MAGYPGLLLRVLSARNPAMGPGKARLVGLIAETGSISAAAKRMGMSYRRAWQLVEALNKSFNEPVVVTAVGGKRGGGAVVTQFGKRLVEAYHGMEAKASAAIAADLEAYAGYLKMPGAKKKTARSRSRG
jgi:molybdate transport system regulatory protein